MFVQTEETPNENALKFIAGNIPISKEKPYDFPSVGAANGVSKLAKNLFEIGNIDRVFFGANFITITKEASVDWSGLKPHIFATIVEHMTNGWPIFDNEDGYVAQEKHEQEVDTDPEIKAIIAKGLDLENQVVREILSLVDERVRPAVAMDGGDINVLAFENGVVYVKMLGACNGCSSSSQTLKGGIETMLKHYVPEVLEVVGV